MPHPRSSFSKISRIVGSRTPPPQGVRSETYRILCFLLEEFPPKVSWKTLWFVTLLLTEEAKDLGCGGETNRRRGGGSAPPACYYVAVIFAPKLLSGLFVAILTILSEDLSCKLGFFLVTHNELKPLNSKL